MFTRQKKQIKLYTTAWRRDLYNKFKYGHGAPKYAECIWVDPNDCNLVIKNSLEGGVSRMSLLGLVVEERWSQLEITPLKESPKIKYCYRHWQEGFSWEDAGAYDYMRGLIEKTGTVDKCSNDEDLVKRYNNLDNIFETIKKEGKVKTQKELGKQKFRELNGVMIHIGPDGLPYFGGGGHHRIAIAKILNLPFPAMLGMVHQNGLESLKKYRR